MALPGPPVDENHVERRATFVQEVFEVCPHISRDKLAQTYDDVCISWAMVANPECWAVASASYILLTDMMKKEDAKHGVFAFKPFDFLKSHWSEYGEQINRLNPQQAHSTSTPGDTTGAELTQTRPANPDVGELLGSARFFEEDLQTIGPLDVKSLEITCLGHPLTSMSLSQRKLQRIQEIFSSPALSDSVKKVEMIVEELRLLRNTRKVLIGEKSVDS